jgi:NAD(P) transhydrogenase subunit beta
MAAILYLVYLLAAVLFIVGLKLQQRVPTARTGNLLSALGMLLAVIATFVDMGGIDPTYIIAGLILGSAIGLVAALRVPMTDMPQMVAIFNGVGGGASALVAVSYLYHQVLGTAGSDRTIAAVIGADSALTAALSILIGSVTLTGSFIAFLKLHELMPGRPILLPARHVINGLLALAVLVLGGISAFGLSDPSTLTFAVWGFVALALVLGVLLVIPIGGADMPVVISLLNSYSGLAAAMTGFVLKNNLLIITGALVGAAGIILTRIMSKAMNRSLANVLFGGFGDTASAGGPASEYQNVKSASVEEAALILEGAQSVVFVPGYGLAVAQAQHTVKELADLLQKRGATVKYAIHPVAGRMPGHMNVLLAESNVPYEQLYEMDAINPEFKATDAVVVIGANDVVNPAASRDPASPIWGMPILNVHEARSVLVLKRSLGAGFAGIKNELFEAPNTVMVFADARKGLAGMIEELKQM